MTHAAADGNTVSVHYTGTFEDGAVFDSSEGKEPLSFVLGKKEVVPGFEAGILGMKEGEKKKITIKPEEAYGPFQDFLVIEVPKASLAKAETLTPGTQFAVTAPNGETMRGTIKELREDTVVLDFNHPLAGKTLIFDLTLISVK